MDQIIKADFWLKSLGKLHHFINLHREADMKSSQEFSVTHEDSCITPKLLLEG